MMSELEQLQIENRRLRKVKDAAEKIYQGRHRVHDEDARSDIYHDIIRLGHALKVVDGQLPEEGICFRCGAKKRQGVFTLCCM